MERRYYIGNSREKLFKVCSVLSQFLIRPQDDYEIVIREHRKARSTEQNRRYWAILNEIAGHEVNGQRFIPDAWHEFFKGKFIGKEEIKLPWGETFSRPISTTTLDVGQFSDYMTQIEAWAAGRGILFGEELPGREPEQRAA